MLDDVIGPQFFHFEVAYFYEARVLVAQLITHKFGFDLHFRESFIVVANFNVNLKPVIEKNILPIY